MNINSNHVYKITETIDKVLNDVDSETGSVQIQIDLDDNLTFYATALLGTNTIKDGDGHNTPYTEDVIITHLWIDDDEYFGVFDEDMDVCYLGYEQKNLITKQLSI